MSTTKICIVSLIVLFLVVTTITALTQYATIKTVTVTVKKVEDVKSFGFSHYLVTTENEVFENTDACWFMKFDSFGLNNEIQPERTYTLKVAGISFIPLRWYRNILSIESFK